MWLYWNFVAVCFSFPIAQKKFSQVSSFIVKISLCSESIADEEEEDEVEDEQGIARASEVRIEEEEVGHLFFPFP